MTVPMLYAHASEDFDRFLVDARDALGLGTRHQTFTVVEAVLWVFRDRLEPAQVACFAQCLPAVLRAIFVEGWDPRVPPRQLWSHAELTHEVQSIRGDHNLAPSDCILQVARVLRRHVDPGAFERAMDRLPEQARTFWAAASTN